jgi:mannose-6-phosphate isomerase-like protein (cupin superfamily)
MIRMKNLKLWIAGIALPAVMAVVCVTAKAQTAAAPVAAEGALAQSKVFPFDQMTVKKSANGSESRDVLHGALATGEVVGMHESIQPAGATPVALHAIQHSELIMVQEGTVGFEHDGKTESVGAGGVIYVAFGTMHRIKNIGDGPAKYFVVQVGGDTKK